MIELNKSQTLKERNEYISDQKGKGYHEIIDQGTIYHLLSNMKVEKERCKQFCFSEDVELEHSTIDIETIRVQN